jgi:hypothetical protein
MIANILYQDTTGFEFTKNLLDIYLLALLFGGVGATKTLGVSY